MCVLEMVTIRSEEKTLHESQGTGVETTCTALQVWNPSLPDQSLKDVVVPISKHPYAVIANSQGVCMAYDPEITPLEYLLSHWITEFLLASHDDDPEFLDALLPGAMATYLEKYPEDFSPGSRNYVFQIDPYDETDSDNDSSDDEDPFNLDEYYMAGMDFIGLNPYLNGNTDNGNGVVVSQHSKENQSADL